MGVKKAGRLSGYLLMAGLVGLVLMCVGVFTQLLHSSAVLQQQRFTVTEQEEAGGALTLRGFFENPIPQGETLWLYGDNAEVSLLVQGQTHRYNRRAGTPDIFRSPGSGWFGYTSPGLLAAEELAITLNSYYGENDMAAYSLVSRLYVGDGGGLYRLLLGQIDLVAGVLICALFVGLLYMLEGIIGLLQGATQEGRRIGIFGAYCFTGAMWCVTDAVYPYLSLIIMPGWAAGFFDALGLLLFPIALAAMMRFYIRGRCTRKVMGVVVWAEVLTAGICLARQFTGQADLLEQQLLIGGIALAALVVSIACIVADLWRYRDNYLFLLLLTALPVFVAVAVDGANILFPFMARRTVMRYGFALSVVVLILQIASYARAQVAKNNALRRMEKELTDSRISVMLSQIQPHFLYNSLAGIKELCDAGQAKATSQALEHFAYYLRGNMETLTHTGLIPFEREVSHVRDYLYLEKIRFEEKLTVCWDLQFTGFLLPPLTLQPIVENAVRHGITEKKGGGTVSISSKKTENGVTVTVADDGVGFLREEAGGHSHIGISNVRRRLADQCGGLLHIESVPGAGTTAQIILPNEENSTYENDRGGR